MIEVELATGERVAITDTEARIVFDELWRRASSIGAITAASMIEHERRRFDAARTPVRLDARQTAAFRKVLAAYVTPLSVGSR